jgi:hypothetical protein
MSAIGTLRQLLHRSGMSGVGCRPDLLLITRNRQLASIENDRRRAHRSGNARAAGLNAPRAGEPPGASMGIDVTPLAVTMSASRQAQA